MISHGTKPTKRAVIRLSALGVVAVLGLIAIARAQWGSEKPAKADPSPVVVTLNSSEPEKVAEPIAPFAGKSSAEQFRPAVVNPFNSGPEAINPLKQPTGTSTPGRLAEDIDARPVTNRSPETLPARQLFPKDLSSLAKTNAVSERTPETRRSATPPIQQLRANANRLRPEPNSQRHPVREPAGFGGGYGPRDQLAGRSNRRTGGTGTGTGKPGKKHLDGPQTPSITVQKFSPSEIQVGKPATFEIKIRNSGRVAAHDVQLIDEIPRGTRLISTTPRASRDAEGLLVWSLGTLSPGANVSVEMQFMPIAEGNIGSVATVRFGARASVRTIATRPELVLQVSGPRKVLIGEDVAFSIRVSNPGSGAATGVVLSESLPPELTHSMGKELEYNLGVLKPGETRELKLSLKAAKAGQVLNVLEVRSDANLSAQARTQIEVIAPDLEVSVSGPRRRYLERKATYILSVHNPGTATAKDVELVSYLPKGLKFVEANNMGKYDPTDHKVRWSLKELPPHEIGRVNLVTIPVEEGELKLRVRGTAQQGLSKETQQSIFVEGLVAIKFSVADVQDPIEVHAETTYEIHVVNQGSKAATNLRLVAILPPQLKATSASGPTRYKFDSQRVLFEPLVRLAPKADATYRLRVKALRPGDLRLRVMLVTDEMQQAVTKEESTRVYSDQ